MPFHNHEELSASTIDEEVTTRTREKVKGFHAQIVLEKCYKEEIQAAERAKQRVLKYKLDQNAATSQTNAREKLNRWYLRNKGKSDNKPSFNAQHNFL